MPTYGRRREWRAYHDTLFLTGVNESVSLNMDTVEESSRRGPCELLAPALICVERGRCFI